VSILFVRAALVEPGCTLKKLTRAAMAWSAGADYPTRPVRIIVLFPPGGSTDVAAPHRGAANLGE
jgi:tripartite-type tricarboxylate transporter receptor subunit TctC